MRAVEVLEAWPREAPHHVGQTYENGGSVEWSLAASLVRVEQGQFEVRAGGWGVARPGIMAALLRRACLTRARHLYMAIGRYVYTSICGYGYVYVYTHAYAYALASFPAFSCEVARILAQMPAAARTNGCYAMLVMRFSP